MPKRNRSSIVILLIAGILVSACTPVMTSSPTPLPPSPTATITSTQMPTATASVPANTPTFEPTPTQSAKQIEQSIMNQFVSGPLYDQYIADNQIPEQATTAFYNEYPGVDGESFAVATMKVDPNSLSEELKALNIPQRNYLIVRTEDGQVEFKLLPVNLQLETFSKSTVEFTLSKEYHQGLQDYLNAMGLEVEAVSIEQTQKEVNKKVYNFITITPDETKLTDLQRKYVILFESIGLFWSTKELAWESLSAAKLARLQSRDIVARIEVKQPTLNLITKVKMEIGPVYDIYNMDKFDWVKVTGDNWEKTLNQLLSGEVPYDNEIFNRRLVTRVIEQINFAKENNLPFVGDALVYPDIFKHPSINGLSAEHKKQAIIYLSLVKINKFPEIQEIDLYSELAAFLKWQSDITPAYNQVGGLEFMVELSKLVKALRYDIKLIVAEDMIINAQKPLELKEHYNNFFSLLEKLIAQGALVDAVKLQNYVWVNAPPTENSIGEPLQRINDLGLQLAAPDIVISTGNENPIWAEWPATSELVDSKEEPFKQASILYLLVTTYFKNGASEIGFHSPSNPDWTETKGDIFEMNGLPTPMYYALLIALSL